MCGIAGFVDPRANEPEQRLTSMIRRLHHRGPDAHGIWVDASSGVGLAHARLSILDLSEHGAQPMLSHSTRYVLTYNGEIYNFKELKDELSKLKPIRWRGHSDTEVILEAIERWGLKKALSKFNGMFAFALFDRCERAFSLVRDRVGIKPLYYGWVNNKFVFASELKAIEILPEFNARLNQEALNQFFIYKYIPAPLSIYEGIYKLMPGSILMFSLHEGCVQKGSERVETYWCATSVAVEGQKSLIENSNNGNELENLHSLLDDAVKRCLLSDVPVGAFLSGGTDSSLVAALAHKHSASPLKTFTIGFLEEGYNETKHAKLVAQHLGTHHHELYIDASETRKVIPLLPSLYDEPFADSSQIPTYLVSHFARQNVTVCLSGDGGDELFSGYGRYWKARALWQRLQLLPLPVKKTIAMLLKQITISCRGLCLYSSKLSPQLFEENFAVKLEKLAFCLTANEPSQVYSHFLQVGTPTDQLVYSKSRAEERSYDRHFSEPVLDMMLRDLISYLPDDILTKVDRASMGVGLEVRVPILDYRVVEHAWNLPMSFKFQQGQRKYILRKLLSLYFPSSLFDRPKQ